MALPAVAVYSLGGTISATQMGGSGVEPSLTGEALVEDVPEIAEVAEVSAESFRQVPGSELTLDDLIELVLELNRRPVRHSVAMQREVRRKVAAGFANLFLAER